MIWQYLSEVYYFQIIYAASFIMKFSSYELVPTDVQDKLMKDFEAKQTEE